MRDKITKIIKEMEKYGLPKYKQISFKPIYFCVSCIEWITLKKMHKITSFSWRDEIIIEWNMDKLDKHINEYCVLIEKQVEFEIVLNAYNLLMEEEE